MSMLKALLILLQISQAAELPFWKAKPDVYRRIVEERAIIVSVTHKKPTSPEGNFVMIYKAAGLVSAPLDFCQKKMLEYDKLPAISSYIKETKYDAGKKELFFWGEAYGFHARMWMLISTVLNDSDFALNFEVLRGHLTGMKGVIRIEDYKRQKSELSLVGEHSAKKLGMPAVLLDFGLEIVLQQVAKKIRNYLEAEYQKELASAK